jgi:DNA repair photolyase
MEAAQQSPNVKSPYVKGRGAQYNIHNKYLTQQYVQEHMEGLDEALESDAQTTLSYEYPKRIVNEVDSPDIPLPYSMNPYQGCEHGCIYCYARNSHQYWGYSAGIDFERRIIVKEQAAQLLEDTFRRRGWKPAPIMLSGNTDCYQPVERNLKITRQMLQVCVDFGHPVGIITKNSLVQRDIDLLQALAAEQLVRVNISITTLDEPLRRALEPRTATAYQRLRTIEALSLAGIPVNVMVAPIIPGLNSEEVPRIMQAAADAGALSAGFTMVRLNGAVAELFTDWVHKNFPDRADKILSQIAEVHGGKLGDSRFGTRMRGEGKLAESMTALFRASKSRIFAGRISPDYNLSAFRVPSLHGQMRLF